MEAVYVCRFRKAEVQKLSESLSFNASISMFVGLMALLRQIANGESTALFFN